MRPQILLFLLLFCYSVSAQPDRWSGLIINESTPDDAVRILGKVSKDKIGTLKIKKIDSWLSKEKMDEKYRILEFNKVKGISKVILAFNNNKLIFIELSHPWDLKPEELRALFQIKFFTIYSSDDISGEPKGSFPKAKRNGSYFTVFNNSFEKLWYRIAVSDNTFLVSTLSKGLINSDFNPDLERVQIVSRKLENK